MDKFGCLLLCTSTILGCASRRCSLHGLPGRSVALGALSRRYDRAVRLGRLSCHGYLRSLYHTIVVGGAGPISHGSAIEVSHGPIRAFAMGSHFEEELGCNTQPGAGSSVFENSKSYVRHLYFIESALHINTSSG